MIIICNRIESINFFCRLTMITNIYLKIDIAGYHIFINLLVKYIKNNIVEFEKFLLTLALVTAAILFTVFTTLQKIIFFIE